MMGSILLCAVAMLCKEQGITVLVSKNLNLRKQIISSVFQFVTV